MVEEQVEKKREGFLYLGIGITIFLLSLVFSDILFTGLALSSLGSGMAGESLVLGFMMIIGFWILFWGMVSAILGLIVGFIFRSPYKFHFILRCFLATIVLVSLGVLVLFSLDAILSILVYLINIILSFLFLSFKVLQ